MSFFGFCQAVDSFAFDLKRAAIAVDNLQGGDMKLSVNFKHA